MAQVYLLTRARGPSGPYYPGTLLDDALDPVAAIVASGARTSPAPDPILAVAAEQCAEIRRRGGSPDLAEAFMLEANARSLAASAGGGVTGRLETYVYPPDSSFYVTLLDTTGSVGPSAAIQIGPGRRNVAIDVQAGHAFASFTISGTDLAGAPVEEVVAPPGAGGGTVRTEKVFMAATAMAVASGGGTHYARFYAGDRIGVGAAPVAGFDKLSVDAVPATPSASSLAEGWVEVPIPVSSGVVYSISYRA